MKSAKSYVSDINSKIEELHKVHGIPYRDLPKKITALKAAGMSREAIQAYRSQVYSPEAYHVKWKDGKEGASFAKEETEKIIRADKINKKLEVLSKKVAPEALPNRVSLKDISEYSQRYLTAKEFALKSPNAKSVYEVEDRNVVIGKDKDGNPVYGKKKVSGALLSEIQEMIKQGNIEKEEFKQEAFKKIREAGKAVEETGGVPFQMGNMKLKELDPTRIPSEEELLQKDFENLKRKAGSAERSANRQNRTSDLKENLQRAVMRSNMHKAFKYAIATKIDELGNDALNRLFYTTGVLDFSIFYDNTDGDLKAYEIMDELGIEELGRPGKKRKQQLDEYELGLNREEASLRYQTRLYWDERTQAERHMDYVNARTARKSTRKRRRK